MVVDLVSPRPDVVFMRRRLKIGEQVTTAPVAVQPSQNFLSLSSSGSALTPETETPIEGLPKKPSAVGRTVLSASNPVVRLNVRQSAIGSLVASGVTVFGWQSVEKHSGMVSVSPTDSNHYVDHNGVTVNTGSTAIQYDVPVTGNRKLVEFVKGEVVVGLRHIRKLRRLILGAESGLISINLLDGANIILDTENGSNVAYISFINGELEIRFEKLNGTIDSTFSITSSVS